MKVKQQDFHYIIVKRVNITLLLKNKIITDERIRILQSLWTCEIKIININHRKMSWGVKWIYEMVAYYLDMPLELDSIFINFYIQMPKRSKVILLCARPRVEIGNMIFQTWIHHGNKKNYGHNSYFQVVTTLQTF